MPKVKKQHFLPQFYLRHFADSKGKICVVDKNNSAPYYRTRVEDVAQGRYFYDFHGDGEKQSLEKLFGIFEAEMSNRHKCLVEKSSSDYELSLEDKEFILAFFKLQFIRSDWLRDKIPQDFIIENFKPDYTDNADKLLHAYIINEGMFTEHFEYLREYGFKVFETGPHIEIFTSSFPFYFHSPGGVESILRKIVNTKQQDGLFIRSNMFFPLSSTKCLYIHDKSTFNDVDEDNWFSLFVPSGFSWSMERIYFRENSTSLELYPVLKRLLQSRVSGKY